MINSKEDYKYYLHQDRLVSEFNKDTSSLKKMARFIYRDPVEIFLELLRKYEYLHNKNPKNIFIKLRLLLVRIRFKRISVKLGFSIPINVFGPGLSIPHYGTIVVNSASKIGKNCRLHVGVNIGANSGSKVAPTIGDNVYIGPGAILFGDIRIANNITIGGNATVNKSFDLENSAIAGTPAKVIKENFPTWLERNEINL
jgi:serine O-acetyltransferase